MRALHCILTGEVPGLFTNEELAKELAPLEKLKDGDATYAGPDTTYAYFTSRCVRVYVYDVMLCACGCTYAYFTSRCVSVGISVAILPW